MKTKQTIHATVNKRLLQKASRLFTGTIEGRIIEVLQNARRAGATCVSITNKKGITAVTDNGRGIDDFQKLLDMGGNLVNRGRLHDKWKQVKITQEDGSVEITFMDGRKEHIQ